MLLDWAMKKNDIKLVEVFCRLCPKIANESDELLNLQFTMHVNEKPKIRHLK